MIPTHPDAMTTAWLEQALAAPRHSLAGFSATPIGTGQMSKSFRLALEWKEAGGGPTSIVAKCPASDEGTRSIAQALNCYTLELGWYRELSHTISVNCPQCLFQDSSHDDLDFVLLLEDMAPARQGDQLAGASIPQIEAALRQAARLHAPYWADLRLNDIAWLRPKDSSGNMVRMLMPPLFLQFRERYANRLSSDILEMGAAFVARLDKYLDYVPNAPTAQHRDFRIDNILFSPDAGEAHIVDWQTLGVGSGIADVAYLIGTSIADPKERAKEEQRLVDYYANQLVNLGVIPNTVQIWREYKLYAFSGFLMAVFAAMNVGRTERGDEMFAVMTERPAWQALHLGSLSLL
ncbi:phosphotransferase family protein [Terricaulis sp.]|uniref:phosphotransferase family protein n=1 Tax=Terricaulis sp. TaxID=2768686 RepID=UPI0037851056